ncbi:SdpI family protein [Phaeocystidibacter luteus]|uniref:SdpI family protein n=1 Tax=Phaeocystidibacter luteus TaxID=911197 RepID=A0A6N6RET4_9FLAO|nr:SdpI family protein [Phaeocystidibacter luteus]KAB2808676.1 SdpI family protein [Phaeocystidibacter luteus]
MLQILSEISHNPVILVSSVILILFRILPPKEINGWYGYRTSRSMKSTIHWNFAQRFSANMFLIINLSLLAAQLIAFSIYGESMLIDVVVLGLWLVGMVYSFFQVEKNLEALS